MVGQAPFIIFADGLDRPCSVSFTSYLRTWGGGGGGGMFLDNDVRTFFWGESLISHHIFGGEGLLDFLFIKIFSFIF